MRREFKKKSKVLLIDDNYEHLAGIRELLNIEGTFDVVGIATNVNMGLNLIKKYQPDIVLLDMNMPERDGLQGILEISKLDTDVKVLALSGYDDADLIFRAMKIGARGYVLKTMASAQLIYAIEEVLNGKIYLPLALSSRFFEYFQQTFREENAKQETEEENLLSALAKLGMDLNPIFCGNDKDYPSKREQWHSGANFFAFAPGKVLGYERNYNTLDALVNNGFEIIKAADVASGKVNVDDYQRCVVAFKGNELARGGGGARCMTMPLLREQVQ